MIGSIKKSTHLQFGNWVLLKARVYNHCFTSTIERHISYNPYIGQVAAVSLNFKEQPYALPLHSKTIWAVLNTMGDQGKV